jgi:hypothetical protein
LIVSALTIDIVLTNERRLDIPIDDIVVS